MVEENFQNKSIQKNNKIQNKEQSNYTRPRNQEMAIFQVHNLCMQIIIIKIMKFSFNASVTSCIQHVSASMN